MLKTALDSVFLQTYQDFEVIVVDDGSSDQTQEYLNSIIDKRLVSIKIEHQGRSSARNWAMLIARGEYITFLDSDDIYHTNKIETQLKYLLSHPNLSVVYSAADVFLGENVENIIMRYSAECEGDVYRNIACFFPHPICLPTVFIKKEVVEAIGLFDPQLDRFEDTDYWRRIAKSFEFGSIKESTCLIRTHEGNAIDGLDVRLLSRQVMKYVRKVLREDLSDQGRWLYLATIELLTNYAVAISKTKKGWWPAMKLILYAKYLQLRSMI
jgi:glycosyltransferase involved in cell wall biosynthesis